MTALFEKWGNREWIRAWIVRINWVFDTLRSGQGGVGGGEEGWWRFKLDFQMTKQTSSKQCIVWEKREDCNLYCYKVNQLKISSFSVDHSNQNVEICRITLLIVFLFTKCIKHFSIQGNTSVFHETGLWSELVSYLDGHVTDFTNFDRLTVWPPQHVQLKVMSKATDHRAIESPGNDAMGRCRTVTRGVFSSYLTHNWSFFTYALEFQWKQLWEGEEKFSKICPDVWQKTVYWL